MSRASASLVHTFATQRSRAPLRRDPAGHFSGAVAPRLTVRVKRKDGDVQGQINAGLAFDRQRLKRNGTMRTADQSVGVRADPHGNAAATANVLAGERSMMHAIGRRQHRPYHSATKQFSLMQPTL